MGVRAACHGCFVSLTSIQVLNEQKIIKNQKNQVFFTHTQKNRFSIEILKVLKTQKIIIKNHEKSSFFQKHQKQIIDFVKKSLRFWKQANNNQKSRKSSCFSKNIKQIDHFSIEILKVLKTSKKSWKSWKIMFSSKTTKTNHRFC